jgi:hypothetical protein
MTPECVMPGCRHAPTTANRRNQPTCPEHVVVTVSDSWMTDPAKEDQL